MCEPTSDTTQDIYNYFENNLLIAQNSYIPKREYRNKRNDPKWFNNKIRHLVAVKKGNFRRLKDGQENIRNSFNTTKRTLKAEIRKAKRNYEIKVAREAKVNVKAFFQLYKANARDGIGPIKTPQGSLTDDDSEMNNVLNE